jgi:hypothetical protein
MKLSALAVLLLAEAPTMMIAAVFVVVVTDGPVVAKFPNEVEAVVSDVLIREYTGWRTAIALEPVPRTNPNPALAGAVSKRSSLT